MLNHFGLFLTMLDNFGFFHSRNITLEKYYFFEVKKSNIRKGKYSPATTTTPAAATATVSRSGYPPWILKRGGLESSGRIPSS